MSSNLRAASLRSPLSVARGLGAAKSGTGHFWAMRVTSVALVPLTLWFVASLLGQLGQPQDRVLAWLGSPWVATGALLFVGVLFYHAHLGLRTVMEDYIASHAARIVAMLLVDAALALMAVASALAIVRSAL